MPTLHVDNHLAQLLLAFELAAGLQVERCSGVSKRPPGRLMLRRSRRAASVCGERSKPLNRRLL